MKSQINKFIRLGAFALSTLLFSACGAQATEERTAEDLPIEISTVTETPAGEPLFEEAPPVPASGLPVSDDFAILFVNVGKADAAILRFGQTTVLIDTGSVESVPRLVAGLNALNVSEISAVFLTHSHNDHLGGLAALAANYDIPVVYSPFYKESTKSGAGKIVKVAESLGLNHVELNAGETVDIADGASFSVLGPLVLNPDDDNDNSLVLRLHYGGKTFLFTGDMQFAEEQTLIDSGADLKSDVLKVGNHGNPDATGADFAALVFSSLAVISTDTNEDEDSANPLVFSALSGADVFVTSDFPIGVLVTLDASGSLVVSSPTDTAAPPDVSIGSVDADRQVVTLVNQGSGEADLSGCVLLSSHSGAVLRLPDGTVLDAGESLEIGGDGDLSFPGEDKPLSKKKDNTLTLFGRYGSEIDAVTK